MRKIVVETYLYADIAPASQQMESHKVIDHDKSSDRKWLGTHCFWAMRNNRKVVTYPAPDAILESF